MKSQDMVGIVTSVFIAVLAVSLAIFAQQVGVKIDVKTCPVGHIDNVDGTCTAMLTPVGGEVGYFGIAGPSCDTSPLGHRTDATEFMGIGPRLYNTDISYVGCYRAWTSVNISSIPDDAQIIDTDFKFEVNFVDNPTIVTGGTIYSLENRPQDTGFIILREDIRNGTQYVVNEPNFRIVGSHIVDLGPLADADLESDLETGMDWFGIGLSIVDERTNSFKTVQLISIDSVDGNTLPTIIIKYRPSHT